MTSHSINLVYKTTESRATATTSEPDLMETVRFLIRKAAIRGSSKEDLLAALATTLGNYTYLRNAPAAVAVLLFIRRTCLRDCGFVVDDGELRDLWV